MRNSTTAIVLLLLAGCGGGGAPNPITDVSANPPSPEPEARSIAPTPAKTPAITPPAITPAPLAGTPAPQPVPPPATAVATVDARLIAFALTRVRTDPSADPTMTGARKGDPNDTAYYQQTIDIGPLSPVGSISFLTAGPSIMPASLSVSWERLPSGGIYLGETVYGPGGVELKRPDRFLINPTGSIALDQTIAEWLPQSAADPWFAQLQVQTDPTNPTSFQLCWHIKAPQIARLACSRHNETGRSRGIYVIDDSNGLGPRTWATQ